jgi:hypothetical protein
MSNKEEEKMKRLKMLAILTGIVLLVGSVTGCGQPVNPQEGPGATPEADIVEDTMNPEDETIVEIDPELPIDNDLGYIDIGFGMPSLTIEELTAGLIENEYPDLVVSAVVLERMAILPGSTIRVTVTISNEGEETIAFVRGSGTNEIPDALKLVSDDLQPILSQDRLGIATMDFQIDTLEPGESLNFSLFVRAIEPNENFDNYTFKVFADNMTYIGDLDWGAISHEFPSLTEVEPGPHSVSVYFFYTIVDSEEFDIFGTDATGFNVATLEIVVD